MENFNFMAQTPKVERLLQASQAALAYLPAAEHDQLVEALRTFERFGVPTCWSAADVDPGNDYRLTDSEKAQVVSFFVDCYECTESDWMALDTIARDVLAARELHVRVQYDPCQWYTGDASAEVSDRWGYAYLPLTLVQAMEQQDPYQENGVELAFTKVTKLDSMHIVAYTMEPFNQHGEAVELPSAVTADTDDAA